MLEVVILQLQHLCDGAVAQMHMLAVLMQAGASGCPFFCGDSHSSSHQSHW